MSAAVSAVLLGFVLGLQHATDPDHLVAVATIVTRERRFRDGALVGALWGLGHTATLTVAGGLVVALGIRVPASVATGLDVLVAAMIVGLGVLRFRDALRGAAATDRLLADHDHHGREAFHSHPHAHGRGHAHAHPHVHPSRALLTAGRLPPRALAVGAVHGLAGTAAVSLLVLMTLPSVASGFVYLGMFSLGTITGMTALTAVMAWPIGLALKFRRAHRLLSVTAGLAAIAFGVFHATRLI